MASFGIRAVIFEQARPIALTGDEVYYAETGLEIARGAKKKLVLSLERVPLLPEIAARAEQGVVPGGTKTNLAHAEKGTRFLEGMPEAARFVLADAQTNGGLLACVPEKQVKKAIAALEKKGVEGWVIGQLVPGKPGIEVI
jgi:selenide,water dikinase